MTAPLNSTVDQAGVAALQQKVKELLLELDRVTTQAGGADRPGLRLGDRRRPRR